MIMSEISTILKNLVLGQVGTDQERLWLALDLGLQLEEIIHLSDVCGQDLTVALEQAHEVEGVISGFLFVEQFELG